MFIALKTKISLISDYTYMLYNIILQYYYYYCVNLCTTVVLSSLPKVFNSN